MLDQKVTTPFQHMWLSKLLGYDFSIEYKQGKENVVADALSRISSGQLLHITLINVHIDFLNNIKAAWTAYPQCAKLISELQANPASHSKYTYVNNELRRRGKLVIGQSDDLKLLILKWLHDSPIGGHSGRDSTLHRVKSLFYWPGLAKTVHQYIRNCSICQQFKFDNSASPGLLQPLPIPNSVWESISMDFIEGLPPSHGKHTILVVIDKFSKYAHFLPLSHPFTAISVAQLYMDHVFKLHGNPTSIISDRDPIFLSEIWQEVFKVQGVDLNFF